MRGSIARKWLVLATALLVGSCGGNPEGTWPEGDAGSGETECGGLEAKLRSCNLIGAGPFLYCRDLAAFRGRAQCIVDCLAAWDCAQLSRWLCPYDSDVRRECVRECGGVVACADGSGDIQTSWICDGEPDCDDNADEMGCPQYTCADSSTIDASGRCDGAPQCADGSDEMGCDGRVFTCGDGTPYALDDQCDLQLDCADGSDEATCAPLTCP